MTALATEPMKVTPQRAYQQEVRTTARPYIGGLVFTAVIIGTLVGTIFYTAFSEGGDSDLKAGMTNLSLIGIIPTLIGVRLAHQNFILDHREVVAALRNLGMSNGFFRRQFLRQGLFLILLATVSAVVLGRLIVRPFLALVLLGMNKELPYQWGSPLQVIIPTFVTLLTIYVVSLAPLNAFKVLEQNTAHATSGAKTTRMKLRGGITSVLAAFALGAGVWSAAAGASTAAFVLLFFTSPFLALAISRPLGAILGRGLSRLLHLVSGWSPATLGIRSAGVAGTLSRIGLVSLVVAIPLVAFTWVESSLAATRHYSAEKIHAVDIVVQQDLRLIPAEEATQLCDNLGEQCQGVISWQPSDVYDSGETSVPMDLATDYTLAGSSPEVLSAFIADPTPIDAVNPFRLDFMQLFAAVSQEPPVAPQWALLVANPNAALPDGYTSISSHDWVRKKAWNSQLYYGPNGDGTAGFIPLSAYMLLATCVILVVSTLGKLAGLRRFFSPLGILGRTRRSIAWSSFWALLFPYAIGTLAAVIAAFWYAAVAHTVTTGTLGAFVPFMPAGLWVLFAVVFIGTSMTAFIPAPDEESRSV